MSPNPEIIGISLYGIFATLSFWYAQKLIRIRKKDLVMLINKPERIISAFTKIRCSVLLASLASMLEFTAALIIGIVFPEWFMSIYLSILVIAAVLFLWGFAELGRTIR